MQPATPGAPFDLELADGSMLRAVDVRGPGLHVANASCEPCDADWHRQTITFALVYQQHDEDPVALNVVGSRAGRNEDVQPVQQRLVLSGSPETLPLGWLTPQQAGTVVLENRGHKPPMAKPTAEEQERLDDSTVVLHVGAEPVAKLAIGEFIHMRPVDVSKYRLTGPAGCRLRVTILPVIK